VTLEVLRWGDIQLAAGAGSSGGNIAVRAGDSAPTSGGSLSLSFGSSRLSGGDITISSGSGEQMKESRGPSDADAGSAYSTTW